MPSVGHIYFERTDLPGRLRLDPGDPRTIDFDAPVYAVDARHAMSDAFEVRVEFEQYDPNLELAPLLWRRALVDLAPDTEEGLAWQGVVEAAEFARSRDRRAFFEVTLRPAVHRLAYRHDTRIFQNKSIPEIVESVVASSGQEVRLHLGEAYPPVDYLVQYQETDWELIQRLLADEGLFSWFEHSRTAHVLHIADDHAVLPTMDAPLRFVHHGEPGPSELSDLELISRVTHDAHISRDWDWQRPAGPFEGEHAEGGTRRFERYEFPGGATDEAVANRRARRHQEANAARRYELRALAGFSGLAPGRKFTLVDAQPEAVNSEYLVVELTHRMVSEEVSEEAADRVDLVATPTTLPFRPSRRVRRPAVHGRESALVTGPSGEEIHVDEFGRVKVHAYWDRLGARDEHASRWVRVLQPSTAGSMYLPRVDWEVSIAHLHGDPNRPLVTHKLFNEQNRPPYPLPDSLPLTAWRSASSPGGSGGNEVRFDDTNGAMEFYVHACRDMHRRVGRQRFEAVGLTSTETVAGQLNTSGAGSESVTVGVDDQIEIRGSLRAATAANETVTVAQLDSLELEGPHTIANDGDRTETSVGPSVTVAARVSEANQGDHQRTVGGAELRRFGGAVVEAVGGNQTIQVGGARVTVVAGDHHLQVGGNTRLEAQTGAIRSRGPLSVGGAALQVEAGGALSYTVTGAVEMSGGTVSVQGQCELRARAGGSELLLGGDVLDVDASSFSGSGAVVKLIGQIEMVGGDSVEQSGPPEPSPGDDWIEIRLIDIEGNAVEGAEYLLQLPDGTERRGSLDSSGSARVEELPPGSVTVSFPGLEPSEAGE
ncbi:MAG: type VI secretion system tip protein VgrG [Sandaracinaceae bacterium]|nr:MAG: type VI secretion system tip protein VgrG [Sandaracinaceae bacterium]